MGLRVMSEYVGYASLSGSAGNIYQIILEHRIPVQEWAGMYGVLNRLPGYNFEQTHVFQSGDIVNKNPLFDCLQPDTQHEVYASVYPVAQLDLNTIYPATHAEIDAFYAIDSMGLASAEKTLSSNISFNFGNALITAPGTYTYKLNEAGQPHTFAMVALKDANGKLFFGGLDTNLTLGFNRVCVDSLCTRLIDNIVNYQMLLPLLMNQSETPYYFFTDPNDQCPSGEGQQPNAGNVIGNISTQSGLRLENVIVEIAGRTALSTATGFYNLSTYEGTHNIYAIKEGYLPYVNNLTVIANDTVVHNIVMLENVPPNPNTDVGPSSNPDVGPGVGPGEDQGPGEVPPVPIEEPKQIEGIDYIISLAEIKRKLRIDTFQQEAIYIYSFKKSTITLNFELEGDENLSSVLVLDKLKLSIEPNSNDQIIVTMYGRPPVKTYYGNLTITGDLNVTIPIEIEILPKDQVPVEALLMNLETNEKTALPGQQIKFKNDLRNLLIDRPYPVSMLYTIQPIEGNETVWSFQTNVYLKTAFTLIRSVDLPKNLKSGDYVLRANANYLGLSSGASTIFHIAVPFWSRVFLGLRYWVWLIILVALTGLGIAGYLIHRNIEGKKKYHLKVEDSEMPKPGPRNIYVGKIAETDKKTYMNLENFKVHTIVAGSTGGGKSVSAQVIVEEALEHDVAVICFDPTAQWTGMLRPCKDKMMLSLYPFFGMNKTDARAFNGNIRMLTNAREIIDIKKYVKPGEIQVFACHKLDPRDMDVVVANAIREIFHANFGESKPLKVLFVFDEVHRLLPKFGGSGDGFLQIERGCREFRKWGLGILLISQVLSDFVGTIKANINTEIQMRTRDEGDLERIRVKYGEEVLRSLVKATVGSGLVENPAYNRGKPYFVAFKPLRHSVERMPDDEIEEYNKYNDIIDDLQYSLEQLEKENIDVFDLKLELKLALDKVKTGNFNMVKIYLEGLTPRIDKQWEKLGKHPKKYEKKIVDDSALKAELQKAQEERAKFEADQKANAAANAGPEKKKEWGWKDSVPPDKLLSLVNGMLVISFASLYDEITAMKDKDYDQHVTDTKNDFADWIQKVSGEENFANNVRAARTKDATVKILEMKRDGKKLPEIKSQAAPSSAAPVATTNVPPAAAPGAAIPPSAVSPAAVFLPPAPAATPVGAIDVVGISNPAVPAANIIPPDTSRSMPASGSPSVLEQTVSSPAARQPEQSSTPAPSPPKHRDLERMVVQTPTECFLLENGIALKSMKDLAEYLPSMDDDMFGKHVGDNYNHFADWVRGVFHDDDLADRMAKARTRSELLAAVTG